MFRTDTLNEPTPNMIEFCQGMQDLMKKHNVVIDIESEAMYSELYITSELRVALTDCNSSKDYYLNSQIQDDDPGQDFNINCKTISNVLKRDI